jgi:hypothetical protein
LPSSYLFLAKTTKGKKDGIFQFLILKWNF